MHVIGRTGKGKSKLLEWMIREDIKAEPRRGLLVLDPHGDLYRAVLRWMIAERVDRRRLLLVDLNQMDWSVGLNYLDEPGMTPDWIAGRAEEGIAKVFGDERPETMPILRNWLRPLIKALILTGLGLSEGRLFMDNTAFRNAVKKAIKDADPDLYDIWEAYESDRKTQEIARMAVRNRVMPFATEEMRAVVGQERNTINWRQVMDEGMVVLANLAAERVSAQSQQMLGVIMLHQVVSAAKRRPEGRRRRFYVYCDEFQNYVTEEFGRSLVEMRKFAVSFVLAHHYLGQIERAGDWVLRSIITQPEIRVVFDPGGRDDAEVLARELFTGTSELTGSRVKDELYRTFFEPTIVREDVESMTESDTSGDSYSHTTSVTYSTIPVTHHKERRELASRTYRSLEEEREKTVGWLLTQRDRHALLHIRGKRPMRMVTPEVKAPGVTERFQERRTVSALARGARLRAEAEAQIQRRRARLAAFHEPVKNSRAKRPEIPARKGLMEQE